MQSDKSTAIALTGMKAHRWLENSRRGRVAAVYQHCLYLADHRDSLICLGSRRLGPGPINALCDADWEGTGSISAGDAWQRKGDALHVGAEHCFRIDSPTVWRPAPAKGPLNPNAIADNLHRARVFLSSTDTGPLMPLLLQNYAPCGNRLQSAFEQQASDGIHALSRWLDDTLTRPGSAEAIPEGVINLIGLGPGLTPSGDDFLGGAMVALETLKLDTAADWLAAWIKQHAPALTNSISLAHLSAACDGEALEPVHRGLNAILDGSGEDGIKTRIRDQFPRMRRPEILEKPSLTRFSQIEAALAGLGAVGHSSGWDAFSGVLAVVDSWQRERGAHPRRDCA